MIHDKKIFSPELRTYGEDISKRWRVEYWTPTHNGTASKRVVIYGKINTGTTIEERYRIGLEIIDSLDYTPKVVSKNILQQVLDFGAMEWRPKTLSAYKTVVELFIPFLKKKLPEHSTDQTINDFLMSVFKNTKSSKTVNKYRNILYLLFNRAITMSLIRVNPVKKIPRKKSQATSLLYFNDAHIAAFRSASLDPQLWLAIRFCFYCFIRPGEMRHLRIADINFDYGFVELNSSYSKNKKTEKVIVPISFLKEIEHLKNYSGNSFVLSRSGEPGAVQIATNWIYNTHKAALKMLKIVGRYSFYSWKHTGAVKAVRAGINLKDLQLQLRHHSLDMVNEYLKQLGVTDSEDLRTRYPSL